MIPISGRTLVRRVEGYANLVSDGLVVGSFSRPVLLSQVGRRIWDQAEYAVSIDAICRALFAEFEIAPEDCYRDTIAFIEDMSVRGLMVVAAPANGMRDRYLGLLKRTLSNLIYADHELRIRMLLGTQGPLQTTISPETLRDLRYTDAIGYRELISAKQLGLLMTPKSGCYSHTVIGVHGLSHIESLAEDLFRQQVPGDFVDAGTLRGGAAIFMRALQQCHGEGERQVWVADCFEGVPASTSEPDLRTGLDLSAENCPWLVASMQEVQDNFQLYGLLDEAVRFLPGLFADTLEAAPIQSIALLRIDADLYSSTLECLEFLYDRVSVGGYVIVDDYGCLQACREAVDNFRERRGITSPLQRINWSVVHWRKDA